MTTNERVETRANSQQNANLFTFFELAENERAKDADELRSEKMSVVCSGLCALDEHIQATIAKPGIIVALLVEKAAKAVHKMFAVMSCVARRWPVERQTTVVCEAIDYNHLEGALVFSYEIVMLESLVRQTRRHAVVDDGFEQAASVGDRRMSKKCGARGGKHLAVDENIRGG